MDRGLSRIVEHSTDPAAVELDNSGGRIGERSRHADLVLLSGTNPSRSRQRIAGSVRQCQLAVHGGLDPMTHAILEHDIDELPASPGEPRRTVASVIRATLLNVAAAGGLVCIVLVVLAVVFNITLIMFKTGSMSPTIPTGSLAVVKEIPAQDARIGDVVTVDRPGELPITHRVVSARQASNGFTQLVLRGDANPTNDPLPYTVKTVRIVLWSAPGLAYLIIWFSNPFAVGGITLGVTALVTWALWPRKDPGGRTNRRARHAG
jgi:signal peptidase